MCLTLFLSKITFQFQFLNTFASERFLLEENLFNEPFCLENVSTSFFYDNFNKKIYQNSLVKIVIQNLMCQILYNFKTKLLIFFYSKRRSSEAKVLKFYKI